MKKISVIAIVCALLLMLCVPFGAFAADQIAFNAADKTADAEGKATLVINYTTEERLQNGVFRVEWNKDELSVAGQGTSDLKNAEVNIAFRNDGYVLVGFMNPANEQDVQDAIEFGGSEADVFPKSGNILTIPMKVKNLVAGEYKVTVTVQELVVMSGNNAAPAPFEAKIIVEGAPAGDGGEGGNGGNGGDSNVPGGDSNVPGGDSNVPGGEGDSNVPGGDSNTPAGDSNAPAGDSNAPAGDSNAPAGDNAQAGTTTAPTTTKKAGPLGEATPWALLATVTVAGAALVVLSTKKSK